MGQALLRKSDSGTFEMPQSSWRKHRLLKWLAVGGLCLLAAAGIGIAVAVRHAEPFLRDLIVTRLSQRFHARVELGSFHISLAHGLRAQGRDLRIWPPANVEGVEVARYRKPLIHLDEFHFRAPLHFPDGKPVHIWTVILSGLTVDIPPRPHFAHSPQSSALSKPPPGAALLHFRIDNVVCRKAKVILESSDPAKQPLEFNIRTLDVKHVKPNGSMDFDAVLTNPRPRGLIDTQGTLGPWVVEDPGQTPLAGTYSFNHADLSVFKGIAGMLDSTGRYRGSLRNLTVDGTTHTPNFSLSHFGTALPLDTSFHARVDGTNGNTWLEPVRATLGHTRFTARGKIVQVPAQTRRRDGKALLVHPKGHAIDLSVDVEQGQIGDFLRLTSRSGDPLLTGALHMKTSFDLPPGSEPVHERMRLKGTFRLENAQFSNPKLQQRIAQLSWRGQGKPDQAATATPEQVASTMEGDFSIADALVKLPRLVYIVPGARIDLHGAYNIDGGAMTFRGTARLQATLSHVVGGWKGLLLTPLNPLFQKGGAGTKVGIHVYGTRKNPQFGLDF